MLNLFQHLNYKTLKQVQGDATRSSADRENTFSLFRKAL